MIKSFFLSLACFNNKAIRSVLWKTIIITIVILVVAGFGLFSGGDYLLSLTGLRMDWGSWTYMINVIISSLLGWFIFRVIAVMILWMFADEIVEAIEREHYNEAAVSASKPSYIASLLVGLRSLLRALIYNILAIPLYIIAAFTIIGAPIIFLIINGILLGRELEEMVTMRHKNSNIVSGKEVKYGLGKFERFLLGTGMNAAMMIPFVNFIVPVIAASMATHMVHRQKTN